MTASQIAFANAYIIPAYQLVGGGLAVVVIFATVYFILRPFVRKI